MWWLRSAQREAERDKIRANALTQVFAAVGVSAAASFLHESGSYGVDLVNRTVGASGSNNHGPGQWEWVIRDEKQLDLALAKTMLCPDS